MGHRMPAMGLVVLIKRRSQVAFLRARDVQYAQGWLIGKPMPLPVLVDWLDGARVEARRGDRAPA